ncbi:MAG: hypothetical protein B0W54_08000 [Cellvibrio sp. 79]|nr:MAG: hypothetical protein B0W54_08000 [Cellvibrio sp. 79]
MQLRHSLFRFCPRAALIACLTSVSAMGVIADEPGTGKTAPFEIHYLTTMIDHHYSALRVTELAAGTEKEITSAISSQDRVHPTPGFNATEPHAILPDIKSMARSANRMQREEILMAQQFLKEWYGIEHEPQLSPDAQRMIAKLEALDGTAFDKTFLVSFASHHYEAAQSSLQCLVARDLEHHDLHRYCENIVNAQVNEIDHMRHLACKHYQVCDIQPQRKKSGHHAH